MTRFGIVGTGRISDWVLQGAVQDPRFKAVAVCSRSGHSAAAFIYRHPEAFTPDAKAYSSIDDMLADDNVDAIYIGTPNTTHYGYAMSAIRAGKHVLCEKPMACTAEEVEGLAKAARAHGVLLMEAMISTLQPAFRAAADHIPNIGQVRSVSFSYCQYSSKYDDLRKGIAASSLNPQLGGGAIEDLGIYTVYPIVSLFGKPAGIDGAAGIMADTPFGPVDVQGSALLHYAQGFTAQLTWSKACDGFAPSEICGEGGNILIDSVHLCSLSEAIPHGKPASGRGAKPLAETLCRADGKTDAYYYEWKEFMDTLEAGNTESGINSLETSLITRQVMDEIKHRFRTSS